MSTPSAPLCRECEEPLTPIGTKWVCAWPACERFAVPVNEYGRTPDEEDNFEPHVPHWTDEFPKGTNLRDQGDGQPYIWARNE